MFILLNNAHKSTTWLKRISQFKVKSVNKSSLIHNSGILYNHKYICSATILGLGLLQLETTGDKNLY